MAMFHWFEILWVASQVRSREKRMSYSDVRVDSKSRHPTPPRLFRPRHRRRSPPPCRRVVTGERCWMIFISCLWLFFHVHMISHDIIWCHLKTMKIFWVEHVDHIYACTCALHVLKILYSVRCVLKCSNSRGLLYHPMEPSCTRDIEYLRMFVKSDEIRTCHIPFSWWYIPLRGLNYTLFPIWNNCTSYIK